MFTAPWVCRSCSRLTPRTRHINLLRRAASTASNNNGNLPRALLQRAQSLAAEHTQLSTALESSFDPKLAKRVGELSSVSTALEQWRAARDSLAELEGLMQSNDAELRDMAQDDYSTTMVELTSSARKLSLALTPKHPFADMPCLLEFKPGPGGAESRLFTDALFRMYQQYCLRKGYRAQVVKYEVADEGEIQGGYSEQPVVEAVLEVQDAGAYDVFRGEAGMHRVQRIPSTEKNGRTHTSATAIWVLPSFGGGSNTANPADFDDPESDFFVDPTEVRSETMRARGAGGQHVNKTESAIRLTHLPTGTTVSMQDSRSQGRNREDAWRLLRARVAALRREEREERARQLKSSVLSKAQVTRGDKIRTYNYQQDRCTDHRSGVDVHNLPGVLAGGEMLDKIIGSVRDWLAENEIRAMIAEDEAASLSTDGTGEKK